MLKHDCVNFPVTIFMRSHYKAKYSTLKYLCVFTIYNFCSEGHLKLWCPRPQKSMPKTKQNSMTWLMNRTSEHLDKA